MWPSAPRRGCDTGARARRAGRHVVVAVGGHPAQRPHDGFATPAGVCAGGVGEDFLSPRRPTTMRQGRLCFGKAPPQLARASISTWRLRKTIQAVRLLKHGRLSVRGPEEDTLLAAGLRSIRSDKPSLYIDRWTVTTTAPATRCGGGGDGQPHSLAWLFRDAAGGRTFEIDVVGGGGAA
jgi:hypothetical protein